MLNPTNLVQLAEELAARIPDGDDYKEERNVSWGLVSSGWLQLNDLQAALRALSKIDDPQAQAAIRLAACKWICSNPDSSNLGAAIKRSTIAHVFESEPWLSRRDMTDLVPFLFRASGRDEVRVWARTLRDPFTAGNMLVTLAEISDLHERKALLEEAEHLASGVGEGDRDYALLWVLEGYEAAGLVDDASRVKSKMREQNLSESLHTPLSDAATMLRDATGIIESSSVAPQNAEDADTPLARLIRFQEYGWNDLKIRFLIDEAALGGISDNECESILMSADFQKVEGSRPTGIHRDPTLFENDRFARFWFARPLPLDSNDKTLLEGEMYFEGVDATAFLKKVAKLFRRFDAVGRSFSEAQIDQGLWFLFGYPFFLAEHIWQSEVPLNIRLECLRSMIHPFRDYYTARADKFAGTCFFMWWDNVILRGRSDGSEEIAIEDEIIAVLEAILALPNDGCANSALHGLNHLHPNPRAISVVTHYLDMNRQKMTSEQIHWVSACRDGLAL